MLRILRIFRIGPVSIEETDTPDRINVGVEGHYAPMTRDQWSAFADLVRGYPDVVRFEPEEPAKSKDSVQPPSELL